MVMPMLYGSAPPTPFAYPLLFSTIRYLSCKQSQPHPDAMCSGAFHFSKYNDAMYCPYIVPVLHCKISHKSDVFAGGVDCPFGGLI